MQERPHVMRGSVSAGCFVCSLHLLGVVVVPGYGGYGGDETSPVMGFEMDHANPIVVVAR